METGTAVRDLGFIAWRDDQAALEKMRGAAWDNAIQEEKHLWAKYAGKLSQEKVGAAAKMLHNAQKDTRPAIFTAGPNITIAPAGSFSILWKWNDSDKSTVARDLVVDSKNSNVAFIIRDAGNGSESYILEATNKDTGVLWKRSPVGPQCGIIGGRIYYLGAENYLRYNRLYSCNTSDGGDEQLLYEEKDARYNLYIQRTYNGSIFLIADNAGSQRIAAIGARGGLHWISAEDGPIPLSFSNGISSYISVINARYMVHGTVLRLPYDSNVNAAAIEWIAAVSGGAWVVMRTHGTRTLYWCSSNAEARQKYVVHTGTILYDGGYGDNPYIRLLVLSPNKLPHYLQLSSGRGDFTLHMLPSTTAPVHVSTIVGRSSDGTEVHGRIVTASKVKLRGLLVIGYGAYGMSTNVGTCKSQWAPLLTDGWAIAYAFIRGGGDHTNEWIDGGRHLNRERSIEDYEAIIAEAQVRTGCNASNTVIYGRSAGGLLVGATLNRGIAKIAGVYAEVPYVDLLRTTSNPSLPLTEMEYEEFGDPRKLVDFMLLSAISPIDNIRPNGPATNKFVICRSGLRDKEVLPYEPLKWIRALRAVGPAVPKILAMEVDEGHFYSIERGVVARATDLAMLLYFVGVISS